MAYILIVGAKSDMAIATAKLYAAKGYGLYLAGRNINQLEPLAADLNIRHETTVELIEWDVLDYDNHQAKYTALKESPTGVLMFAGYLGDQKLAERNVTEAQKVVDINYTGPVSVLEVVAADMEERKAGFIIGVSSVAGERGRQSNYHYGAAKAGFTAYLSGLRNRLNQSNVKVLTVKPGFVATKMTAHLDLSPLLTAKPEHVAQAIYIAQQKGKNVLYVKWMWRWIMLLIKMIPESIFKKMSL